MASRRRVRRNRRTNRKQRGGLLRQEGSRDLLVEPKPVHPFMTSYAEGQLAGNPTPPPTKGFFSSLFGSSNNEGGSAIDTMKKRPEYYPSAEEVDYGNIPRQNMEEPTVISVGGRRRNRRSQRRQSQRRQSQRRQSQRRQSRKSRR